MAADTPEHASPDVGQLRLTYSQLAERLNISGDAARVLVRRRGWFRIIPNKKGQPTIVVVTAEDLAAELNSRRTQPPTSADSERGGVSEAVALLDRTLSRMVEAERRADEAERHARDARLEAQSAREDADLARAEAREAREAADLVRIHVRQAEAAIDALKQAEALRRGQGRWARLRAAWRGE